VTAARKRAEGISFRTKRPIIEDLKVFLPATFPLVIPTILLSIVIGMPLGIYGAAGRGGKFDQFGRVFGWIEGSGTHPFRADQTEHLSGYKFPGKPLLMGG